MAEARELRTSLPEDKVAFVYLCEDKDNEDVWIENVVKSKSKGLHIKLSDTQNDFFVSEWELLKFLIAHLLMPTENIFSATPFLPTAKAGVKYGISVLLKSKNLRNGCSTWDKV